MSDWWCKLVEIDGKQVIFKRSLIPSKGVYKVEMIVQASDWLEGSTEGEATATLYYSSKPFTVSEFDGITKQDVPKLVDAYIKPLLYYCKGKKP